MFESLKSLIDSRLGKGIVLDDFMNEDGFFIKIRPMQLYSVAFFLKNDPDVRLTLLDQIIVLPTDVLPWTLAKLNTNAQNEVIYQLKSLKLPYRVSLVLEIHQDINLLSIAPLYGGARWQEADICKTCGCSIEQQDRG